MRKSGIYLDANAGSLPHPSVCEVVASYLHEGLANPSSVHVHGRRAKKALSEAREAIAESLGKVDSEEIIAVSSGTEANQLAIRSALEPFLTRGEAAHWITTGIEHDCIEQMISWAEERGCSVSRLPLTSQGVADLSQLPDLIQPQTKLVSLGWVNSETGVILDGEEAGRICSAYPSLKLHLDAAQAWGKIEINVRSLQAHFVALSGHKIGALSGCGILWTKPGSPVHPFLLGKQEKGRRGGSENLLGMISLGEAVKRINPVAWSEKVRGMRDWLEEQVLTRLDGVQINGKDAPRVANTLNVSFDDVAGEGLVLAMDLEGFSVSAGSACSSGALEPSRVLLAMGRSRQQALSALRISLSDRNTLADLELFTTALTKVVGKVRNAQRN